MNTLLDSKLAAQLENIRANHLEVYMNLKVNIDMVFQKLTLAETEKSFLNWQTCTHTIYHVEASARAQLAWYLKTPCHNSCESYFVVAPDQTHAALYHLDAKDFINGRCHLFGKNRVVDILETFAGYLSPRAQVCTEGNRMSDFDGMDDVDDDFVDLL